MAVIIVCVTFPRNVDSSLHNSSKPVYYRCSRNPYWMQASSYRPICNLTYLTKLRPIERVVVSHLAEHSSTHKQSAYWSFHSTETPFLSVHNHLIRSTDNGKVSFLVLLDLSAAFDTVDHQIGYSCSQPVPCGLYGCQLVWVISDRPDPNFHMQRWADIQFPSRL